jgi:predicted MPP superfamily phosphohydrolase
MATGLIWFIFGAKKLIGHSANIRTISFLFYGLAALVSFYGIWNAFHPHLKNIEVEIENLPPVWKNKIVVQLSDVHLGIIHGTTFLNRVVSLVNAIKPHMILITGDLFDGMAGDLTRFIEPLNNLQASKGVFFVTGNHEGYLGLKKPLSILRDTHISVLDMEVVDVDGLQIVGISFPEFEKDDNVKSVFESGGNYNPKKPSILLYHTPTNITRSNKSRGSQQFNTYWFPDVDMAFVKQKGIDLQLSGHTHRGQIFPFGYLTKKIFKGYDYGLHKYGRFNLYTTSGVGTWGPPMRIGSSSEIPVIKLK